MELHYQPEIDLRTGQILGVEALVRWDHPTRGFLSAHTFVSAAEEAGSAGELGWWVIRRACEDFAGWRAEGLGAGLTLRINVSPILLDELGFVEKLAGVLRRTGVERHAVCVEITERQETDFDAVVATVRALKGLGVQVSIDSFGTYNSSIKMVQRLPVDGLEIDRHFRATTRCRFRGRRDRQSDHRAGSRVRPERVRSRCRNGPSRSGPRRVGVLPSPGFPHRKADAFRGGARLHRTQSSRDTDEA